MADDDWFKPPAPPRQAQRGEVLYEFLRGHDRILCEVHDDLGTYGTDVRSFINEEFSHMRVVGPHVKATWRALSLQAEDRAEDQVAKAKAIALDINVVRNAMAEFRQDRHVVVVRPPKPKASESFKDSVAWLRHEANDVVVVQASEEVSVALESALAKLATPKKGN